MVSNSILPPEVCGVVKITGYRGKDKTSFLARSDRPENIAFYGIGKVKASALWNAIRAWNETQRPLDAGWLKPDWTPTLGQLLTWATMEDPERYGCPPVPLWGKKTRAAVRAQIPLELGQDLQIRNTYVPDETTEE